MTTFFMAIATIAMVMATIVFVLVRVRLRRRHPLLWRRLGLGGELPSKDLDLNEFIFKKGHLAAQDDVLSAASKALATSAWIFVVSFILGALSSFLGY